MPSRDNPFPRIEPDYRLWAKQMLGLSFDADLPEILRDRLDTVAATVRCAGGELRSRQVVAMIVAQYLRERG